MNEETFKKILSEPLTEPLIQESLKQTLSNGDHKKDLLTFSHLLSFSKFLTK